MTKYGSPKPIADHELSVATAIATASENILMLSPLPRWLLLPMPFKRTQIAAKSSEEFGEYMQELVDEKIIEARRGERIDGMDLMGSLERSSYRTDVVPHPQGKELNKGTLSQDDIRGNTFIMLASGHETSAGVLQFILLELANNPVSQRSLRGAIDEICGDGDPSLWDYENLINPKMASMLGACINETLRMTPAVVEIPVEVPSKQGQTITIDGKSHLSQARH
ncbi:cytochrome P450 [Fusarium sp. MPI-SDFR-AT-0072]|nr:cytochrome P450 [Fusarium sp. MPI-SDFR-AT-0072]